MSTHRRYSTFLVFASLTLFGTSTIARSATLPTVSSANLSARFSASDINGDGGATDPGNGNDVNSWKELVGGTSLIHNFPTDGKPTFLTSGIGGQKTVRFVSDGGVDAQPDDLLYDNPANFNAQTVFVVATMGSNGGNYSAVVTDQFAGLNIRKDAAGPNYYPGNSGDFVTQGVNGTFNINGNPRLDIPGGYNTAHVVKAVSNSVQNYNGVRISDNVAADRRWDGDVAEILFYDGVLNGNDTARVNKYLIDKYGVNQVVDEPLSNTSQIADDPWGPGRNFHTAVNFHYSGPTVGTTFKGIGFDNVDLAGGSPPTGPFVLNANALTAGATLTLNFPFTVDNTPRNMNTAATISGVDDATIEGVADEMFYVGFVGSGHDSAGMTFGNLMPLTDVYVQVIGGHNGWNGDMAVAVNGVAVPQLWTTVTNGITDTASIFGFYGKTDATGQLQLDFTIGAGNFAGIGGIIITQVPEPASLLLLGLASLGLLRIHRRSR